MTKVSLDRFVRGYLTLILKTTKSCTNLTHMEGAYKWQIALFIDCFNMSLAPIYCVLNAQMVRTNSISNWLDHFSRKLLFYNPLVTAINKNT